MNSKRIILINTPEHTNIGDHLITLAEYAFFHKYLPFYEIVEITAKNYYENTENIKKQIVEGDVIVITGGGFLGSLWQSGDNVPQIIKSFPDNRIIIFPQSMYFEDNQRGNALKRQTKAVFCGHKNLFVCFREQYSYERALKLFRGNVKQFLIPDMALGLVHSEIKEGRKGVLLCLRKDKESILSDDDKNRISMVLREHRCEVKETSMHTEVEFDYLRRAEYVEKKLDELKEYSLVVTDTLHCMISCFLSNIPCIIFDNLTNKLEGVYSSYLSNLPYIQLCTNVNMFSECLKNIGDNNNRFSFIDNKCFLGHHKKLVELITGESPFSFGPSAIIKDQLYFSDTNSPGVVFEYNIAERKIENKFLFSLDRFFLYAYKDELWLIPKKSKKIIIFNIQSKGIPEMLSLECLPDNISELSQTSIFAKPLLEGSILWILSIIGLIKVDLEKRTYHVYTCEKAGFSVCNLSYTLQLVNSKLYMFGESCFVFDIHKETMKKWLEGKKILVGFVDEDRVISVPVGGNEKDIVVTDLSGREVYRKEIPMVNLTDYEGKRKYKRAVKCQNLCFFVPLGVEGTIVYNTKSKEFSRWCTKDAILDVKKYKDSYLLITMWEDKILNFEENGELIDTHVLKESLDDRLELIECYENSTLNIEHRDKQLETWMHQLSSIVVTEWNNESINDLCSCGNEIWNETKIYLKELES